MTSGCGEGTPFKWRSIQTHTSQSDHSISMYVPAYLLRASCDKQSRFNMDRSVRVRTAMEIGTLLHTHITHFHTHITHTHITPTHVPRVLTTGEVLPIADSTYMDTT